MRLNKIVRATPALSDALAARGLQVTETTEITHIHSVDFQQSVGYSSEVLPYQWFVIP
jgi:hypothetical protein